MYSGQKDDVNNSISIQDVYSLYGSGTPDLIGVPQMGLQYVGPTAEVLPADDLPGAATSNNTLTGTTAGVSSGMGSSQWWVMLAITFVVFIWLARKYGGGDSYSNIRMSVYNGLFLTFFIVIMLNFLKVIAARWPIPGFSTLVLAA